MAWKITPMIIYISSWFAGEDDRRIAFGQLKRFSWRELQLATDGFSERNVLGQGGFGKVYKGVLSDNTKIAVKRLTDYESPAGESAFMREIELISVAVHRNLLKLIGFCTTPSERLLVYPFMQNLSVAYRLRGISFLSSPHPHFFIFVTQKSFHRGLAIFYYNHKHYQYLFHLSNSCIFRAIILHPMIPLTHYHFSSCAKLLQHLFTVHCHVFIHSFSYV